MFYAAVDERRIIINKYLTGNTVVYYNIDCFIGLFNEDEIDTLKLIIAESILDYFSSTELNNISDKNYVYVYKIKIANRILRNISDYIHNYESLKYSVREESLDILNNLKTKFYNKQIENAIERLN